MTKIQYINIITTLTVLLLEILLPVNLQIITRSLCKMIRCYQNNISSLLTHQCKFTPTCSQYSLINLQRYGSLIGIMLTIKRLLKCHPFTTLLYIKTTLP